MCELNFELVRKWTFPTLVLWLSNAFGYYGKRKPLCWIRRVQKQNLWNLCRMKKKWKLMHFYQYLTSQWSEHEAPGQK